MCQLSWALWLMVGWLQSWARGGVGETSGSNSDRMLASQQLINLELIIIYLVVQ